MHEDDQKMTTVGFEMIRSEPLAASDNDDVCYFCNDENTAAQFHLDRKRLVTKKGYRFSLGGPLVTCARCAELFANSHDAQLVTLQQAEEAARWARIDGTTMVGHEGKEWRDHAFEILLALHTAAGPATWVSE